MTAFWVAIAVVAMVILLILANILRAPTSDEQETSEMLTVEELVSTAVELDSIHQRLDIAWCQHEFRDEAHRLRRELDAELRRIDTLESGKREK